MADLGAGEIIGIIIGALGGAGGVGGLIKLWLDKRAISKRYKEEAKLAKKAMKYDKQDAATIFKTFVESTKGKDKKE